MAALLPASGPFRGRLILPTLALGAGVVAAAHWESTAISRLAPPLLALLVILLLSVYRRSTWKLAGRKVVSRKVVVPGKWLPFPLPLPPRYTLVSLLLLPIFLLAGHQLARPLLLPPTSPTHLYNLLPTDQANPDQPRDGQDLVLTGILQELPRQSGERTRLLLAVDQMHRPDGHAPAHGLIQLTINGRPAADLRPGEPLMVRVRVGPVRSFAVPGAFDYRQFLAHRGVHLGGWVANPMQLAALHDSTPESFTHRMAYLPERWRTAASQRLDRHLAGEANLPVLRALLIGDRSGIEPAVLESFKAGGAMHLLAISGMHLGMIALLSMAALEWLLKRSQFLMLNFQARKIALLLALFPILGYALITGLQPPAQRALIMTLVFIAAILGNRQWCSLNTLALAALIILVLDPLALFGASFQLSFAATAGIILLVPTLQRHYQQADTPARRLLFWAISSLLVSTVATLVTAPLSMHHFHRVSLLSPLTTLLATPPLFFWTLPLALAGLALAPLSRLPGMESVSELLLTAAVRGLDLTVALVGKLAALPGSFFYLPPPGAADFFCWAGLFVALALVRRHRVFPFTAASLALLLLLLPLLEQQQRKLEQRSRVNFIEVGHGNAIVVELPGNRTVLVDGGGPSTLSTDVGEQLIAPFLRHRRIRRLEAIVISHPHADHYNGVPFLLRHFRPQTLWINGYPGRSADYRQLLDLAEQLGIEVRVPQQREQILLEVLDDKRKKKAGLKNLADFHLFAPQDFTPPLSDPINDQSLVIGYRHGDIAFLLPGDIGMDQERRLVEQADGDFHHQMLAAPHHGRWTSMAPEFVAATAPTYIIVSDNQQMVDRQRLATWREQGATVFTTGRHGTVTCTTDGQQLECKSSTSSGP